MINLLQVISHNEEKCLIEESSLQSERDEVEAGHGNCKLSPRGEERF